MAITSVQASLRSSYIGSSDAAAILGMSPYNTAWNVWAEKTGRVVKPDYTNEACELGDWAEPMLLEWASRKLGLDGFATDVLMRDEEYDFIAANLDGIGEKNFRKCIVEAKTAGLTGPLDYEQWGKEGTDQIPQQYIIQVHHQMRVSGIDIAYVPVLLGTRGRKMYVVRRNADLLSELVKAECDFWNNYVIPNRRPPKTLPTTEILKYIERNTGKRAKVSMESVAEYQRRSEEAKKLIDLKEESKLEIIAQLDDAETGVTDLGDEITYFADKNGKRTLRITERTMQ